MLLPHLDDRSRPGTFGLKEAKLADVYISALSLAKTSSDAFTLRRFDQHHQHGAGKEDFADVLFGILKTRLFAKPSLSVHDIHSYLDRLADPSQDKAALFRELVTKMTAQEHKWFARLVLKQMHLSIGDQHILKCYHEDAHALYNVCGDLQKVVKELWDPDKRLSGHAVRLMEPFKPMLADRDDVMTFMKSIGEAVLVEEKLDGERIQLHYDQKTRQFRYFSRAGIESTRLYSDSLTSIIKDYFKESIVLDGEMMVYDQELQKYLSYDLVKTAAVMNDPTIHPVFMVFDILHHDGQSLSHLTLLERKAILQKHCPVVPDHLVILPYSMIKEVTKVYEYLDEILLRHGEGLILKSPRAPYEIGERSRHWLKLKPDYVNSFLDDVDLLVVGVFWGKGVMGKFGSISGLLCASWRRSDDKYLTFCKVGSGFNREQLAQLSMLLHDHLINQQPSTVLTVGDRPDKFVDIQSVKLIVQIKGMAMVDSGAFAVGKTFRSPRFVTIRADKLEVTSVEEIEAMHLISMRSATLKKPTIVVECGQETPRIIVDHFKNEMVYIHDGGKVPKLMVQSMVQQLNGITVEHPTPQLRYVVAENFAKPSLRLRNILSAHPDCVRVTIGELEDLLKK